MLAVIRVVSIMEAMFVAGPAKNLLEFARRSREGGDGIQPIRLSVVTYQRAGQTTENKFVTASREAGIRTDLIHEGGRFDVSVLEQMKRIIAERQPDIIQTHNVKSHFLMRLSGLWRTHRWLAFHHGYTTTDFKMRCYNQLDRWSLRASDHIVTVCGSFARDLEQKGIARDRITVQHNSIKPFPSVDRAAVDAVRTSLSLSPMVPILLMVGRLSHEKGHVDLLRALDFLRRELKEDKFHLVIAGEGPERGKIEASRNQFGLGNYVTLAGLQHDIVPYYGCADIAVLPSHSEGSPNALLEAMMFGVPVVATRVGGIPEIVTDGETALLVDKQNPVQMARAIQKLLRDPQRRGELACNALAVVETRYSPDAYRRSLTSIYQKFLCSPRKLR
jgi:glycosyltransferase involved in cell wall biosynthesis